MTFSTTSPLDGAPLDPVKSYTVLVNAFTASGGDAHLVLRDAKGARVDSKLVDLDLMLTYFEKHRPATPDPTVRVKIIR